MAKELKKEIIQFLIPVFVITYGLGAIAYEKGGFHQFPVALYTVYVPGLTVFILYACRKRTLLWNSFSKLQIRFNRYWILGPVLVFLLVSCSFSLSVLVYPEMRKSLQAIQIETQHTTLFTGNTASTICLVFFINLFLAPMLNIFLFLGEEIGWRGFLLPRLMCIYPQATALIVGGFIWAIWQAIGILLGLKYPGQPIAGNIMMVLFCVPTGIILQYFYVRSRCIFVPALMHGALTWTTNTFTHFLVDTSKMPSLWAGSYGLIGVLVMTIAASWIYIRWQSLSSFTYKIQPLKSA
ncbi:CPBP family intramembrane metalloprotease [Cytophagaceae bacterium DM2B3-1]|uniref:CPBP family intramembrane metalloprotease n=1 Tax=Xanthocytophaga flava TaxID=3048013 RepID=A0ABT7CRK1_9BACT|nr:CPBP family intramembrane glutamic endopeptidase [Xanthocytophaga flavus]MDJ1468580.1 CPBP family intramembrane metalloprotease [Xanthocytophaga flavus]MDJ1496360.1 CPBP family intramembrane metalloprotease [Xanthocytophaga flavus]